MPTEQINPDTQVALLLTGRFGRAASAAKPLAPAEYNRVAKWLHNRELRPADLLAAETSAKLGNEFLDGVPGERVESLLRRGAGMAVALERWSQRGIRVIGRTDPDYPSRWTDRLRARRPPVVFAVGEVSLPNNTSRRVAVVGSRNASPASLEFARKIGEYCALQEMTIVSGGAEGVDDAAMMGCLDAGGQVVGILASKLEGAATAKKWRDGLRENRLLLLSEVSPSAPFSVGSAMSRNRLIYSLADVAVVANSGHRGGTWAGSTENLKQGWVPLLVRAQDDAGEGISPLLEQGALPLKDTDLDRAEDFVGRLDNARQEWSEMLERDLQDRPRELPLVEEQIVAETSDLPGFGSDVAARTLWDDD